MNEESFTVIYPKLLANPEIDNDDLTTSFLAVQDCTNALLKEIMDNSLIIPSVSTPLIKPYAE
jgi:hypothetical protein